MYVVGDGAVGKTSFLITYCMGEYPSEYIPTVFDNYTSTVTIDEEPVNVGYWDTAGGEDYSRLRPLGYPGTNIFLVCYSIDRRCSFENIATEWAPEIRHHNGDVPILLAGLKSDLQDKEGSVTEKEALEMAEKVKAVGHLTCSSLEGVGLTEVIQAATRAGLTHFESQPTKSKRRCTML